MDRRQVKVRAGHSSIPKFVSPLNPFVQQRPFGGEGWSSYDLGRLPSRVSPLLFGFLRFVVRIYEVRCLKPLRHNGWERVFENLQFFENA